MKFDDYMNVLETYGRVELIVERGSYHYILHFKSWFGGPGERATTRCANKTDALFFLYDQVRDSMFRTCRAIEDSR